MIHSLLESYIFIGQSYQLLQFHKHHHCFFVDYIKFCTVFVDFINLVQTNTCLPKLKTGPLEISPFAKRNSMHENKSRENKCPSKLIR